MFSFEDPQDEINFYAQSLAEQELELEKLEAPTSEEIEKQIQGMLGSDA